MNTAAPTSEAAPELADLENRRLWEDFWRHPDASAHLEKLMETYMPLARRTLTRLMIRLPSHVRSEDLMNSALIGLYGAITRFDPKTGINFEAFAVRRIRGAILDELRACDPLSRRQRELLGNVEKTIHKWTAEHSRFPDHEQLADAMQMELPQLLRLIDQAQPWISLDMPCAGENGGMLMSEIIAVNQPNPGQEADASEMRAFLRRAFKMLDSRAQKILYLYYYEELRLREIALLFDITEARVCQIHGLAVVKLRQALTDMMNPVSGA